MVGMKTGKTYSSKLSSPIRWGHVHFIYQHEPFLVDEKKSKNQMTRLLLKRLCSEQPTSNIFLVRLELFEFQPMDMDYSRRHNDPTAIHKHSYINANPSTLSTNSSVAPEMRLVAVLSTGFLNFNLAWCAVDYLLLLETA